MITINASQAQGHLVQTLRNRFRERALSLVPAEGLALFRVLFGALMCVGLARFLLQGWIETLYVEPKIFFKFMGFSWVPVWPRWGMYTHYGLLLCLSFSLCIGFYTRLSASLFLIGFGLIQLMDVTNYLNHYVLVLWFAFWLSIAPTGKTYSVDAWLASKRTDKQGTIRTPPTIQTYWYDIFRFQIALVYIFAAVAKMGNDWLLHGQPMGIWLSTRTHLPVLGPILALPAIPLLMSWAGFLYDATIVFWLSFHKTRVGAYFTVLAFHGMTSALFDIGMFPGIMVVSTTVFFSPGWPKKIFTWGATKSAAVSPEVRHDLEHHPDNLKASPQFPQLAFGAFLFIAIFQILFPLRAFAYPGHVLWGEQGMRFSWRVMVREKSGSITYHVHSPSRGRTWQTTPHDYLTWRQANEMSGQPDLILQLAHVIAADFRSRGIQDVEVRAETWVSLNGRPPQALIDPTRDLAREHDGLGPASWIMSPPASPPLPSAGLAQR